MCKNFKWIVKAIFLIIYFPSLQAQPNDIGTRINDYVAQLLKNHEFSGVILVGTPDTILFANAYGMADAERQIHIQTDMRFRIASLTKTITAAAIAILARQGKLSLEDKLTRFIPDFYNGDQISIRHLLRHESGLANPIAREISDSPVTLNLLVKQIMQKPLLFEPGSKGRYSNAGYNMLAYVVERASGQSYDTFLRQEIFEPLGMSKTKMVRNIEADTLHTLGYVPAPGPEWMLRLPSEDIGIAIGSGSLSFSAADLYRWGVAIHQNKLFDLNEQISQDWPYGWGKIKIGSHQGVDQTGAVRGFMSSLAVFDSGIIVVLLLNLEHGKWVRTARDLAAISLGEPYENPRQRQIYTIPENRLEQFTGRYLSDNRFIDIVEQDKHLWLFSDGWPIGKFLIPISESKFEVPSDIGEIIFTDHGPKGFKLLTWDFGDTHMVYRREP